MKMLAAIQLALLVSLASFVCSEDLTYNEFILKGYHRYNPELAQGTSTKAGNADSPIIPNTQAKLTYTGAGFTEGTIGFVSLDKPDDGQCGGQIGIEWLSRKYCLNRMDFHTDEYYVSSEALKIFQGQSKSGANSNTASSKSTITLPSTTILIPIKTAAMELSFRDSKNSDEVTIKVPLFEESSKSSDQAKYADVTLRCEPIPLEQLDLVQSGHIEIMLETGWISDLFHKPLTAVSKDTYVTYPVDMPRENMQELLQMVKDLNPKTTPAPVRPITLDTESSENSRKKDRRDMHI